MENDIVQRIKAFLKSKNIKNRALADMLGISEKTLNNKLNGTRGLDLDTLHSIILQFEDIPLDWLLTGKEPMLKPDQLSSVYQSGMNANYQGTFTEPIHTQIGDVGGDSIVGGVKGERNAVGPASSVFGEERAKTEAMKLQQEIKRLTAQNSQLKEENDSLRKSNEELHKALIEEKERVIKILLEKK